MLSRSSTIRTGLPNARFTPCDGTNRWTVRHRA